MSTTIKYKNNVLATLENESISLKTANKFAEADVEINAIGGNPDGKTYQDKYKYVVLEDGEDKELEPGLRYVKQNGTYDADQGKSFGRVEVDVDQVKDLLEDKFVNVMEDDLNGVETIGKYVFYGRTVLRSVSLPNSVTKTEQGAFESSSIESVHVSNNNMYIGDYTFYHCKSLKNINFDAIKAIGQYAFDDAGFEEIEIDMTGMNVSKGTFRDCANLTKATIYGTPTWSHGEKSYQLFYSCKKLTSVYAPQLRMGGDNAQFSRCTSLTDIYIPHFGIGANTFENCTALEQIVINAPGCYTSSFEGCTSLKKLDLMQTTEFDREKTFYNCSSLNTLILRGKTLGKYGGQATLFYNTPFASGGTGGTIYIPKVLYDHLGDGSSLDYKSATNWSTLDSYGTITWAQIEGSEYEHYYADGRGVLQDITQNLTNCTIDNDLAHYHTEFVTQIVPEDGYTTISGVSISMGGVDITSSVYDAASRTITIDSPDGEIVITATGGV